MRHYASDNLIHRSLMGSFNYAQDQYDREEWLSNQIRTLTAKLSASSLSFIEKIMSTAELERHVTELEQLLNHRRIPEGPVS